jgi:hypothetical protein
MKEQLKLKDRRYTILGISRDGTLYGWAENSFSFSADATFTRVWGAEYKECASRNHWKPNRNQSNWNYLKKVADDLTAKKMFNCVWRVYRVGSKHCPVDIDFRTCDLMKQGKIKYDKYLARNHKFTPKQ